MITPAWWTAATSRISSSSVTIHPESQTIPTYLHTSPTLRYLYLNTDLLHNYCACDTGFNVRGSFVSRPSLVSQIPCNCNRPLADMALATNTTCPWEHSAIPDIHNLPIPQNINVMVNAGSNASDHSMQVCCAPNPVHVTEGCPYLWCEVPQRYFHNGSARHDDITWSMPTCLRNARRDNSTGGESRGASWQFNAGARAGTATAKQIGVLVLFMSGFTAYLF